MGSGEIVQVHEELQKIGQIGQPRFRFAPSDDHVTLMSTEEEVLPCSLT